MKLFLDKKDLAGQKETNILYTLTITKMENLKLNKEQLRFIKEEVEEVLSSTSNMYDSREDYKIFQRVYSTIERLTKETKRKNFIRKDLDNTQLRIIKNILETRRDVQEENLVDNLILIESSIDVICKLTGEKRCRYNKEGKLIAIQGLLSMTEQSIG